MYIDNIYFVIKRWIVWLSFCRVKDRYCDQTVLVVSPGFAIIYICGRRFHAKCSFHTKCSESAMKWFRQIILVADVLVKPGERVTMFDHPDLGLAPYGVNGLCLKDYTRVGKHPVWRLMLCQIQHLLSRCEACFALKIACHACFICFIL